FLFTCSTVPLSVLSLLVMFFSYFLDHRDLLSFPTRRSSDLSLDTQEILILNMQNPREKVIFNVSSTYWNPRRRNYWIFVTIYLRSEEHTSELQSRFDLVCRLLLEKKKIIHYRCLIFLITQPF